jgi:cytidine deaminase
VDVAWAVEVGLTAAGPWQERRVARDRRTGDQRSQNLPFIGGERRSGFDRRLILRRAGDALRLDIVQAARIARERALAGFSRFKVGAAIESAEGRIVTGANIENATYGLTMCAERVALFKALSEGCRSFTRIAIVADTAQPTSPCGACRQLLWEFAGDVEIVLADLHEVKSRHQLKELLPHPFDATFIE